MKWHVLQLAGIGVNWHVLAHTGKGTKRTKGTIGKNEDFRTFSKRVRRRRRRKKSNEEAHWLRQERLIFARHFDFAQQFEYVSKVFLHNPLQRQFQKIHCFNFEHFWFIFQKQVDHFVIF